MITNCAFGAVARIINRSMKKKKKHPIYLQCLCFFLLCIFWSDNGCATCSLLGRGAHMTPTQWGSNEDLSPLVELEGMLRPDRASGGSRAPGA